MCARRHGQEGALAPLWNCCKVFLCINSYSKCSVDELFMYYFHNLSASGGIVHPWTLLGDFGPRTLNLSTPGKILRVPMCLSADFMCHRCSRPSYYFFIYYLYFAAVTAGYDHQCISTRVDILCCLYCY